MTGGSRRESAELSLIESGEGAPLVAIHRSGVDARVWEPLASALGDGFRVIAVDRLGWGETAAPVPFERTTIAEQSEGIARVIAALEVGPAVLCGAGIGAVIALDLLARHPELVHGAILVEPPLLAFLSDATEALSADAAAVNELVATGERRALLEALLAGGLPALAPGAKRIPTPFANVVLGGETPILAELGATAAWEIPADALARSPIPVTVVVATTTGALVNEACVQLAKALGSAHLRTLEAVDGLPESAGAEQLAIEIRALAGAG